MPIRLSHRSPAIACHSTYQSPDFATYFTNSIGGGHRSRALPGLRPEGRGGYDRVTAHQNALVKEPDRADSNYTGMLGLPHRLVPFGLLLTIVFAIAGGARAAEPTMAFTQPNGLRIIVAPSHAVALTAIDVWVRAGITRQPADQPGVAHYLEHMLFRGTATRPDESAIDGAIEDLGGTVDASTSYDWAHFFTVVPSKNFEGAMNVLADAVQHATITQQNVDTERPIIADEIARASDDPGDAMGMEIRKLAYGPGHPYGRLVTGLPSDVASVTRDQIVDFYHKYYVPNNTTVVVAGDVTQERAYTAVSKEFDGWAFSKSLPDIPTIPDIVPTKIQRSVIRRGGTESYITIAFFAPSVSEKPDVWMMDVLLTLLGQGGNNRLQTDLLNKQHLVDSITADFLTQRYQGLLTITASFPTGNPDLVEKGIITEVNRLRDETASPTEVDAAKRALLSSYSFDTETVSGRADALGFYDMIDTNQYDLDYIKNFGSVTPDDIRRLANKYLNTSAYSIVTMIPNIDTTNAEMPQHLASAAIGVTP